MNTGCPSPPPPPPPPPPDNLGLSVSTHNDPGGDHLCLYTDGPPDRLCIHRRSARTNFEPDQFLHDRSSCGLHMMVVGESSDEEESNKYESRVHKMLGSGRKSQYNKLIQPFKSKGKKSNSKLTLGTELSTIPAQYYSKLRHVELETSSVILCQCMMEHHYQQRGR